jgi:GDP-mannose 6-dehydrogenase
MNAIDPSNEIQKKIAVEIIESKGRKKVGILGLSFKAWNGRFEKQPFVDVAEVFMGRDMRSTFYDKNVRVSQLTGTNADFIAAKLPHLHEIITE